MSQETLVDGGVSPGREWWHRSQPFLLKAKIPPFIFWFDILRWWRHNLGTVHAVKVFCGWATLTAWSLPAMSTTEWHYLYQFPHLSALNRSQNPRARPCLLQICIAIIFPPQKEMLFPPLPNSLVLGHWHWAPLPGKTYILCTHPVFVLLL